MNIDFPQNSEQVAVFQLIDRISDQFESALREKLILDSVFTQFGMSKENEVLIEDYLSKIGKSSQAELFESLLLVDLELRKRSEDLDSYLERFPQHSEVVKRVYTYDEQTRTQG